MKGLIVGGGIAGLTLAIFLERAGFDLEIVEIAQEWKPVGAGIVLWPNCLKILERLSLSNSIIERGNVIEEMTVTDENGIKISSLNFDKLYKKGLFAISIARSDLHSILFSGIRTSKIMLNDTTVSITQINKKVNVVFRSGIESEYDFVIGADGINSKVRDLLFKKVKLRYSGYTNWRFIVNTQMDFDRKKAYEMWGKGKRFGIVPVGNGTDFYCFALMKSLPGLPENRNIKHSDFIKCFSEFGWKAVEFLNLVNEKTVFIHNDLEDIKLNQWVCGNTILIGDAAHAITPNLGAGAAMAMEDSYFLSEYLINNRNPEQAFRLLFEKRYKRVNRICNDSYRLGKLGTMENSLLRRTRNFISRVMPEKIYINIVKTVTGEV